MSRDADYLRERGWICEGCSRKGFVKAVIWHKDGASDGCQQWEAMQIERLKNPRVRQRFKENRKPERVSARK